MTVTESIQRTGSEQWAALSARLGSPRTGKQCRERWNNHLRGGISKADWSAEEDQKIIEAVHRLGTKWAAIALELPHRTDNSIKNRWHTTLKRQLAMTAPAEQPVCNKIAERGEDLAAASIMLGIHAMSKTEALSPTRYEHHHMPEQMQQ